MIQFFHGFFMWHQIMNPKFRFAQRNKKLDLCGAWFHLAWEVWQSHPAPIYVPDAFLARVSLERIIFVREFDMRSMNEPAKKNMDNMQKTSLLAIWWGVLLENQSVNAQYAAKSMNHCVN